MYWTCSSLIAATYFFQDEGGSPPCTASRLSATVSEQGIILPRSKPRRTGRVSNSHQMARDSFQHSPTSCNYGTVKQGITFLPTGRTLALVTALDSCQMVQSFLWVSYRKQSCWIVQWSSLLWIQFYIFTGWLKIRFSGQSDTAVKQKC